MLHGVECNTLATYFKSRRQEERREGGREGGRERERD